MGQITAPIQLISHSFRTTCQKYSNQFLKKLQPSQFQRHTSTVISNIFTLILKGEEKAKWRYYDPGRALPPITSEVVLLE
jgi:hypothetical protein